MGKVCWKAAVFDLDHTLFDRYATLRIIAEAFPEAFQTAPGMTAARIGDLLADADRRLNTLMGWNAVLDDLIDHGIFAVPPTFDEYRHFLITQFMRIAVPFPFAHEMLKTLRHAGIRTALITNGSHALQYRKLQLVGLLDSFDSILATEDLGIHKPAREPFDEMARRLKLRPEEMLYIGDNPVNDIEGARRAGYTPVWVRTSGLWQHDELVQPELQVDTVAEIPALFGITAVFPKG